MLCSLNIDTNGDDMITEQELINDYTRHVKFENNGTLPYFATDEYFQKVAQGVMFDMDQDNDKSLSIAECIEIYRPVNKTARAEGDCKTQDFNKDGMVDAKEIIGFSEKVGSFPWTCCKPTDDCVFDDSKSLEICQKEALQNWVENEHYPLVTKSTAPVESLTIDDCIASVMIMMQPNMKPCGGEACDGTSTDSSSEELIDDSNEASDEAPTDSSSMESAEESTEAPADDPVVAA